MNSKYAHLMMKNSLTRNRPGVMFRDAPHFDLDSWKYWTNWNHFDIVVNQIFYSNRCHDHIIDNDKQGEVTLKTCGRRMCCGIVHRYHQQI